MSFRNIASVVTRSSRNLLRTSVRSSPVYGRIIAQAHASIPKLQRDFSLTRSTFKAKLTSADAELVAALNSEIRIEKESHTEVPEVVDAFLSKSGFKLVTKDGQDEIELVKSEGGEIIHVYFSLSDATNTEPSLEDEALEEEITEYEQESSKRQQNEAAESEELEEDEFDLEDIGNNPIRVNIVVEKPKGAVSFEALIHDDIFLVESIIPYESAELATSETAENDYKRRSIYQGPNFNNLDPNVQGAVEQFLESRGIDSDLAEFVLEYSIYKENKEYVGWLEKVKDILEV